MDLQKVALQANNSTAQNGQRSDQVGSQDGAFGLPFADMIRLPLISTNDLFANLTERSVTDAKSNSEPRDNDAENERPADEAVARPDHSDNQERHADKRAENSSNERTGDGPSRDDNHREENNAKDHSADSHDSDTSEHDQNQTSDAREPATTDESKPNSEEAESEFTGNVPVTVATDEIATPIAEMAPTINAALQSILQSTQTTDPSQLANEITKAVKESVAAQRVEGPTDAGGQQNAALNPKAEAEINTAIQQALRQIVRQGTGTAGNVADSAAKATDQSVVQQQAQALSDTLKSDKPVKINVNVNNRANVAVSQPSQTLSADAVAAQSNQAARPPLASTLQSADRPGQLQPATTGAGANNAQVAAQAQAATQTANLAASATGERGLANAMTQSTGASQHGGTGGAEATSSSSSVGASGPAQQSATAQRPQQAQVARAPQQAQPLVQQISVNITKAIAEGMDRISIQLRPDNMGRVDVKLNMTQDGRVTAHVVVDRPETLEALRNDSRSLEKALQDAGLQANAGDLNFSLRDQKENSDDSGSDSRTAGNGEDGADGDLEVELANRILDGSLEEIITDTRVDIRA